jgi:hypothetical protein
VSQPVICISTGFSAELFMDRQPYTEALAATVGDRLKSVEWVTDYAVPRTPDELLPVEAKIARAIAFVASAAYTRKLADLAARRAAELLEEAGRVEPGLAFLGAINSMDAEGKSVTFHE